MPLHDLRENTMKILHLLYESRGDYFGVGGGERRWCKTAPGMR
jgi:hypothetical protein